MFIIKQISNLIINFLIHLLKYSNLSGDIEIDRHKIKDFLKQIHLFYLPNRINRMKHFLLVMAYGILPAIFAGLSAVSNSLNILTLLAITTIISSINQIILHVKRLHDFDFKGWSVLLLFVPVIGILWLLAIALIPGTKGKNRFGKQA